MQSVPITIDVSLNLDQGDVYNIIQLMTFDEVNTRVDQSLFSPKLKVINCFNMRQVQPETLPKNSNFSSCLQNIKLKNNTT